ncbi:MAG: hypothetical protein HDQ99_02420 [Lachnospiraceae bacterium]|nr:hypothetical protein [Lachnospiraceae bacterium]
MTEKLYYLCSAIGILLTFFASIAALIVSIISMKSSEKTAKHTNYQNIISTGRAKWQSDLRECASKYFTQIARLCGNQENDLTNILNELTLYHFAIVLLLFKQDEHLHNEMSAIRKKAFRIVDLTNMISDEYLKIGQNIDNLIPEIENKEMVISARSSIRELRMSIINDHQHNVFNEIQILIEREWVKQKYEATDMWKEKKK